MSQYQIQNQLTFTEDILYTRHIHIYYFTHSSQQPGEENITKAHLQTRKLSFSK